MGEKEGSKPPQASESGDTLDPGLTKLIDALARSAARRDHEQEIAAARRRTQQ